MDADRIENINIYSSLWRYILPDLDREDVGAIGVTLRAVDVFGKESQTGASQGYVPQRGSGLFNWTKFAVTPEAIAPNDGTSFLAAPVMIATSTVARYRVSDVEKLVELRVNVAPERLKWDGAFYTGYLKYSKWKVEGGTSVDGFPAMPTDPSFSSNI